MDENNLDHYSIREIHNKAMEYAMEAMVVEANRGRDNLDYRGLMQKATTLEMAAAGRLEPIPFNEPTRSILWVSVASLALCSRLWYTAQKAGEQGLRGKPRQKDKIFLEKVVNGIINEDNIHTWKEK